ncbi:MAG TPA: class I SAM-dependent methyltransferase [Polyangia bacterium]|nr:class I SAM-dependent methyltransferase [Polyangia bacterium]
MGAGGPARDHPAWAGQAVYTPGVLALYDFFVLGVSNRWVWRCPTEGLLALYDAHVSACHLEVGVGTGYFLDRCRFPTAHPAITLLDLNPTPLAKAARRIARFQPRTQIANLLEPLPLAPNSFDSIGLNYVLHCLPGTIASKAVALASLRALLRPGGVLFGSTLLGRGGERSLAARGLMALYNARGIFSNREDDQAGLERALGAHFGRFEIRLLGCGALFVAYA